MIAAASPGASERWTFERIVSIPPGEAYCFPRLATSSFKAELSKCWFHTSRDSNLRILWRKNGNNIPGSPGLKSGIAPRSGARSLAGGKREARNPRETESGRSPHPCGVRGTRGCPDRGYRSLRSLNPRLNSLHRSAVRVYAAGKNTRNMDPMPAVDCTSMRPLWP